MQRAPRRHEVDGDEVEVTAVLHGASPMIAGALEKKGRDTVSQRLPAKDVEGRG